MLTFIQRNSIRCTGNLFSTLICLLLIDGFSSERRLKRSWDFCFNWPNIELLGILGLISTQFNIVWLCLGTCLLVYVMLAEQLCHFTWFCQQILIKVYRTGSWLQKFKTCIKSLWTDAMFLTVMCCRWLFHHFLICIFCTDVGCWIWQNVLNRWFTSVAGLSIWFKFWCRYMNTFWVIII